MPVAFQTLEVITIGDTQYTITDEVKAAELKLQLEIMRELKEIRINLGRLK